MNSAHKADGVLVAMRCSCLRTKGLIFPDRKHRYGQKASAWTESTDMYTSTRSPIMTSGPRVRALRGQLSSAVLKLKKKEITERPVLARH